MKAVEFVGQNTVFAKDQPEYLPLPALKVDNKEGEVITCWKLSFGERLKVLFTGNIWLSLLTFNKPLTPIFMTTDRKEMFSVEDDQ